ncbi:MAG: chemotaxis response regulator protein-glutamate methylesterase [Pseudomonadota bacterium]
MSIEVLIVDDSATVREALREMIDSQPDMRVMATAHDPFQAVDVIKQRVPDVIVLDIEMPRMDGLSFLRRIMSQRPIPVVICSTLINGKNATCVEALRAGAVDVMSKPKLSSSAAIEEGKIIITDKVRAAASVQLSPVRKRTVRQAPPIGRQERHTADVVLPAKRLAVSASKRRSPLVAIGASTGGTQALETVFEDLDDTAHGIVVVQHMPEHFTAAFARRLNAVSKLEVREAQSGDEVEPGLALIAPGGHHLIVRPRGDCYSCQIVDGPLVSRHRPSVDVLFRSVAQTAGDAALGVIMTGMGDDGARGLAELRSTGALTVGQSERSCVVYGMPAEAAKLGAVAKETDLKGITRIVQSFGRAAARH